MISHFTIGCRAKLGLAVVTGWLLATIVAQAQTEWVWRNPTPAGNALRSIAEGPAIRVAVGTHGTALYEASANEWRMADTPTTEELLMVRYGGGVFVAVGRKGTVLTSQDGVGWRPRVSKTDGDIESVAYHNRLWVAATRGGEVLRSADGIVWDVQPIANVTALHHVNRLGDHWFLFGLRVSPSFGFIVWRSADGQQWDEMGTTPAQVNATAFGNGRIVALGNHIDHRLMTSVGGVSWESRPVPGQAAAAAFFAGIDFRAGRWIAVGWNGAVIDSTDGGNWTQRAGWQQLGSLNAVLQADGLTLVMGDGGRILRSPDLLQWQRLTTDINNPGAGTNFLTSGFTELVEWGGNAYVYGPINQALRSGNGVDWQLVSTVGGGRWSKVRPSVNGGLFAVGEFGDYGTSSDGVNWTRTTLPASLYDGANVYGLSDFAEGGGRTVIASLFGNLFWRQGTGSWNSVVLRPKIHGLAIAFGNGRFVVAGHDPYQPRAAIFSSANGATWTQVFDSGITGFLHCAAFGGGRFVVGGHYGLMLTSTDGVQWYEVTGLPPEVRNQNTIFYDARYVAGRFFVVGQSVGAGGSAVVLTSIDGDNWTVLPVPTSTQLRAATLFKNVYLAAGDAGTLLTSGTRPERVVADRGQREDAIEIRWRAIPATTPYAVYRSATGDRASATLIGQTSQTAFVDTTGAADTLYTYWVEGVTSQWSGEASRPVQGYRGRSNDFARLWGDPEAGQTQLEPDVDLLGSALGYLFGVGYRTEGELYTWGRALPQATPQPDRPVIAVAAGYNHALALLDDGTIVAWGDNSHGQLDVPPLTDRPIQLAAGFDHSMALLDNGRVIAWGSNRFGQAPATIAHNQVRAIAAGGYHSLALRADGSVVAWGDNRFGQRNIPFALPPVMDVKAGAWHSVALTQDGDLRIWGDNRFGQTNLAGDAPANQAIAVPRSIGPSNIVSISAGLFHSLALSVSGQVSSIGTVDTPPQAQAFGAIVAGANANVGTPIDKTKSWWWDTPRSPRVWFESSHSARWFPGIGMIDDRRFPWVYSVGNGGFRWYYVHTEHGGPDDYVMYDLGRQRWVRGSLRWGWGWDPHARRWHHMQ
jgi:hypothetical protein